MVPAPPPQAQVQARPNPFQLLFHVGKTARLAGALLADPRITIFRKLLFIGSLLVLALALIAPDTIGALVSEFIIPVVGPVIDIPADAALDWVAIAVAAYNLLRVFPEEVVSMHYQRIFGRPAPKTTT
jgi:hypothetical protein